MVSRFRGWIRGWYETLRIMIFERETYRQLRGWNDDDDLGDFGEVPRPGDD